MSKVIATAVQRSSGVYVYNDKGSIIATLNGGSGPKDGLVGYTGTTVSVRRGSTIYVYNANGNIISTVNAK
jgi:cytochrome oxidase Cu insertion factor (SCO1/SenC/PrrC family)